MDIRDSLLQVYELAINNQSLQKIVDVSRKYMGNPIFIPDCNLNKLAISNDVSINDDIWQKFSSEDPKVYFEMARMTKESGIDDLVLTSDTPILLSNNFFEHEMLSAVISYNKKVLGYVLVLQYFNKISSEEVEFINRLCKILASYISNISELNNIQDPNIDLALVDLIEEKPISDEAVGRYLFKNNGNNFFRVFVLEYDNNSSQIPQYLIRVFLNAFINIKPVIYNQRMVILVNENMNYDSKYKSYMNDKLTELLDQYQLQCGISNQFNVLIELKSHYEQALNALKYSHSLLHKSKKCFYEDIAVMHMFDIVKQNSKIEYFCHSSIFKILEYDKLNNTNWFCTLVVFVFSDCNIVRAADTLFIHRSTMNYRKSKIEEILGHSLNDSNYIYIVRLSIQILTYSNSSNFYNEYGIPLSVEIFPFRNEM